MGCFGQNHQSQPNVNIYQAMYLMSGELQINMKISLKYVEVLKV